LRQKTNINIDGLDYSGHVVDRVRGKEIFQVLIDARHGVSDLFDRFGGNVLPLGDNSMVVCGGLA